MSNQAIWLIALLALCTAFGLYRRHTEGRIKLTRTSEHETQVETPTVTAAPTAPTVTATAPAAPPVTAAAPPAPPASHEESHGPGNFKFGQALGDDVTLVQFSSAFCQPCRATRLLLEDVAASTPGVAHIEIDAEAHLDLVREMGVTRTPTTFILNSKGEIVGKSVGLPKRLEVMNVVQAVTANA
jgi:thiol-disulfide isomerase/thioredoxin